MLKEKCNREHMHWCSICKKAIKGNKVEQHFDKHLKRDEVDP
jgi:hypothetical protein